jgi:flagellar hook-length control protein FliK
VVRAAPQAKPAAKTHHVASAQAAPAAPVAAVATQAVAPIAIAANALPPPPAADPATDADPSAARDDDTAGPAAAAGGGRHTTPAAPAPEAASPASDRAAPAAQAGVVATAPPPAITPQAGAAAQDAIALLAPVAATAPAAAAPATAAATPAPLTAPPTPATQVAHAAAVHFTTGAEGQVTIHLQPAELGAVQVRIERLHDGTANVTVQVERAETLHVLQQDLPHLHQALDRAGVPAEARQVTVELAPSAAATNNTGAGTDQEGNRQNQGRAPRAEQQTAFGGDQADPENPAPRWRPAGLNITA